MSTEQETQDDLADAYMRGLYDGREQERKEFAVHAVDIARKAVEEEREACAKVCLEEAPSLDGQLCAAAIRARGETKSLKEKQHE